MRQIGDVASVDGFETDILDQLDSVSDIVGSTQRVVVHSDNRRRVLEIPQLVLTESDGRMPPPDISALNSLNPASDAFESLSWAAIA